MKRYILNESVNVKRLFGLNEANMKNTLRKTMEEVVDPVNDAFKDAAVKYRGAFSSRRFTDDFFYTIEMMETDAYRSTVTEYGHTLGEIIHGIDTERGTADRTEDIFKALYGKFSGYTGIYNEVKTRIYFGNPEDAMAAAKEVSEKLHCNVYVFYYEVKEYDEDEYPLYNIDTEAVFYDGREIDGITKDSYRWDYM